MNSTAPVLSAVILLCAGLTSARALALDEGAVRENAIRYIRTGDEASKKAVLQAGDEAIPVLLKLAKQGRPFEEAPKGRFSSKAPMIGDPDFEVAYELFVPESYEPKRPIPLLMYVHGTGQTGLLGMQRMCRAFRSGDWILLCPTSEVQARGWTFTEYERKMQLIALDHVRRRYNVDPARIYLGGYSRGGHASWDLPLHHPNVFAASFPMAGGPRLRNIRFVENLVHTPMRIAFGSLDEDGMVWCLHKAIARMKALGMSPEVVEDPEAGHAFSPDYQATRVFLEAHPRPLVPRVVTVLASQATEARSAWVGLTRLNARKAELPVAGKGKLRLGGKDREVDLLGVPHIPGLNKMPPEKRWEAFTKKAEPFRARLVAERGEGNRVDVTAENIRAFTIYVSPVLFDLTDPIDVWVNGRKRLTRRVKPSAAYLLDHLEASVDWYLPYVGEIRITGNY